MVLLNMQIGYEQEKKKIRRFSQWVAIRVCLRENFLTKTEMMITHMPLVFFETESQILSQGT